MGAPSAAALGDWSLGAPFALCACAALLYGLGSARTVTPAGSRGAQRRRAACFYGGLLLLALALCSPLDALSDQLFWAHMVQHIVLLAVAPPLLLLARPGPRLWRALPLSARRTAGRALLGPRAAPSRATMRALGQPPLGFALFSLVLLGWHVPALFDATLRSAAVHALEHALFLAAALLLWKHVIDSPPLHAPLRAAQRVAYAVGAMIVSWALAVALALAPHPLYAHYAHELTRPGGISALADQQVAAGIMWVPGSLPFLLVVFVHVHRWLAPAQPRGRASRLAEGHG